MKKIENINERKWWLVANADGSQWVSDGSIPPISNGFGGWKITADDCKYYWTGTNEPPFNSITFPIRTLEQPPLEIEIDENLNVYWYKS